MKEIFSFRGGRKTPDNLSEENPYNQLRTENPFHLVCQAGFEPRTPEVKGEERLTPPTRLLYRPFHLTRLLSN